MIRSVTVGLPLGAMSPAKIEAHVEKLLAASARHLGEAGIESRTLRFTLPAMGAEAEVEGTVASALQWVDGLADRTGVRWYCLPINLCGPETHRERLSAALAAVSRFPRMFLNLIVADQNGVSVAGAYEAADLVLRVSRKSNNGFDNFRVGASSCCPPNTPFFPFSRHEGPGVAFSFALETTAAALELVQQLGPKCPIDQFRDRLIEKLSEILTQVQAIGEKVAADAGVEFRGVDASFAPFPNGGPSVGRLVELLSGAAVGGHGSIFVTALLTDCIRAALAASGALPVGFNGVMYSLLEDEVLAAANNRRNVTLDGLIAMSSVCACGVDMIPVPGASFVEEIASVILDVSAMSLALKKPLGARLLPVPGKTANESTAFNLDFLCDSRVMSLSPTDHAFRTTEPQLNLLCPREPGRLFGTAS